MVTLTSLRQKLSDEYRIFKSEISTAEYIFWWAFRIAMFIGAIDVLKQEDTGHFTLQMVSNTMMLFLLPELHLLPRKKCFLARLSYHNQTAATAVMMLATYLGNYHSFYSHIPAFDFIVHFLSGVICVFVGYDLAKALAPKSAENFDAAISSIVGFGLSCFAAVFWEIYEFTFDCIANANTQGFELEPETVLVRIFTATQAQFPLFDVMTDLVGGFLGAVVGGAIFRVVLESNKKKQHSKFTDTEAQILTAC